MTLNLICELLKSWPWPWPSRNIQYVLEELELELVSFHIFRKKFTVLFNLRKYADMTTSKHTD